MYYFCNAVNGNRDPQRNKSITGARELDWLRRPKHKPTQNVAKQKPNPNSNGQTPHHVNGEPSNKPRLVHVARLGQCNCTHNEGECQAVIQTSFRCKRETRVIFFA